jgi:hypothetical protein
MLLLRKRYGIELTSLPDVESNDAAINALISHSRVGRPRLWVVLFWGAIDGALEGVPINVLPPEEDAGDGGGDCGRVTFEDVPVESKDLVGAGELFSEEVVGDGGGACSDVESLDRFRGLVDMSALLSYEEFGVGGGSRRPVVARWEARVERWDLVGVRGADGGCASQFWHLLQLAGESRPSWRSSGVWKILVVHE